jgi:hypothetical protein
MPGQFVQNRDSRGRRAIGSGPARSRFCGSESILGLGFSLNQSYHPAPLYSVKGVHDVVPVEYGQEMFHRSGSVARPGRNIFPQDASSVLNRTNERILIGIIHDGVRFHRGESSGGRWIRSGGALSQGSSVPRQLPPSPIMVLARGIKHALGVCVHPDEEG